MSGLENERRVIAPARTLRNMEEEERGVICVNTTMFTRKRQAEHKREVNCWFRLGAGGREKPRAISSEACERPSL